MALRLPSALRRSLAARVFVITITIFTIASGAIGTAIFTQIEDRIISERIDSSIGEARSTIAVAEFRLTLIQSGTLEEVTPESIESTFEEVMALAIAPSATVSAREIALIKSPDNLTPDSNYSRFSNFVERQSIPNTLREALATSDGIKWERTEISYTTGERVPGVAIGKRINAPFVGGYEMYVLFNFEQQQASIAIIARGLIIAYFFIFLMILVMAYLIIKRVIDPIRKVAEVAQSFTAGDFTQRVNVSGEDEIASLGRAFNEMAFSIEQQISRLEDLSRMQQRFVADVSHELRNPLTTVRMASEVILGAKGSFDPVIARSAEILMTQILRFDQLLTDLLEVSRFDAAVATIDYAPIPLLPLIREAIDSLDGDSSRFTIRTSSEAGVSDDEMVIDGDRRRVTRILRNLMSNALDHSEGKEILITADLRESSLDLGVRDFGVGMTREQCERVFERFWRADPSRSRERGGTGLGLAIAMEDARLHGGTIRVHAALGRGALFLLTLPIHSGQPILDAQRDIVQQFDALP